jgi:hypothetical protein
MQANADFKRIFLVFVFFIFGNVVFLGTRIGRMQANADLDGFFIVDVFLFLETLYFFLNAD